MASLDDAITFSSPSDPTSISPAAPTSSTSKQRSASSVSKSTTSKSATRLSASCTMALANAASQGISRPWYGCCVVSSLLAAVGGVKAKPSADYLVSDVGKRQAALE